MKPMVSVVIPVYNSESTIIRTLDSVKNQTYSNLEIVLVDDGSKDNSNPLMREYIRNNPDLNIKLISKSNGGVSSARNVGIENCTGEYIAFLDSDDAWLPNKTETQLNLMLENPKIDSLGSNLGVERIRCFGKLVKLSPRLMLLKNLSCIQTTIIKSEVLKDIGFFYEDQDNEDSNLIIRIAHKYNAYFLNECYVEYGFGKHIFAHSGLNSRLWEMEKGELKNIKMAVQRKMIFLVEYPFIAAYSLLKYSRRVIIKRFKN